MELLQEIDARVVVQKESGLKMRWFQGKESDLSVWQNSEGDIVHFQLSYGTAYVEWDREKGLKTGWVDDGESNPGRNRSPIVHYDPYPDRKCIGWMAAQFDPISIYVDRNVRSFILQALHL